VLISLLDSDLHDDVQSTGNDIAFADNTGWLDHEIESFEQDYSPTHAKLVVWVRVPSLSTSIDTIIYLYYGNASMSPRENPTGVWDANYKGVWHLSEDPTGTIYDSTSNNHDGTPQGSMNSADQIDGQIDGCLNFDGNDEYIDFGNPTELQITGSITVEAWFKADYYGNTYLVSKNGPSGERGWDISFDDINLTHGYLIYRYALTGDGHADDVGNVTIPINQWHHVVGVFSASTYSRLFLNGQKVDENTTSIISSQYDAPNNVRFGARGDALPPNYYNGTLDEVRISNIARSADWIKTEYDNQFDPNSFYSIGKEYSVSDHPPDAQYFLYYKEIIIDHTMVSGPDDLLNFPLLFSCFDEDLHDKVQLDGDDIAFSDSAFWFDHEIELFNRAYNSTHAQLVAWVRIPKLSTSWYTIIRMYYGNSTMSSRENPSGVWTDYVGVWHFSESSGDAIDSSPYDVNGTTTNIDYQEPGQIGYCFNWTDGDSSQINYGNPVDDHLDFGAENLTISLWVNLDQDVDTFQWIIYKGSLHATDPGFSICSNQAPTNRWRLGISDGNQPIVAVAEGNSIINYDEWHYVVGKVDRFSNLIYIYQDDGTAEDTKDISSYGSISNDQDLLQPRQPNIHGFDGLMDEFRLTDICRSEGWINTEYNNQNDPSSFYSIGKEYTISGNPPNSHYFKYYKQIIIDHKMVNGSHDLLNFPLLISILDSDLYYHVSSINGYDIAFAYNGAWLDHEIELFNQDYNGTHSQLTTWVSIPRLSTSVDTIIHMYYGNLTMESRENPIGVWDENYEFVLHMNQDPSSSDILDSTSNGFDFVVEPLGSMTSDDLVDGQIGKALAFDGVDDYIYLPLSKGFSGPIDKMTFEFWLMFPDGWIPPASRNYLGIPAILSGDPYLSFYDNFEFHVETDSGYRLESTQTTFNSGTWYHFSAVWDGTGAGLHRIYISGSLDKDDSTPPTGNHTAWNTFSIGAEDDDANGPGGSGSDRELKATLSEFRLSKVVRSADWIATEYNNQYDPHSFFTVGPEETMDNSPPTYSNLIESSDPLELGETEVIKINVSDPSGINQAIIEFEGSNDTMTNIGGDTWQYDSWTPGSVGNYTYTIWMEDNYNNWNSTIGTIEVIDTTPPTYSNLIESQDPLELGKNETIEINVFDLSGVNQTLIEYGFVPKNHSMIFVGGNKWSWSKWQPELGFNAYKIYMQDNQDNWNMVSGNITVITTTAPIIVNLTENEDPLELGNNFIVQIDIESNESISTVLIELDGINRTMTNKSGNRYEYVWNVSEYIESGYTVGIDINYIIYANDSNNNWASPYRASFQIKDTIGPTFSGLFESAEELELGDIELIIINCTDLAGINEVRIEYETSNEPMINLGGDQWHYNWTPSSVGNKSYTIWAKDNNTNWNFIIDSILVQDTTFPVFFDLIESSNPTEIKTPLLISIKATDLADIFEVLIEYENLNHTMEPGGGDVWEYNDWMTTRAGNYSYKIYIKDKNNNINSTNTLFMIFQDTISPVYFGLTESSNLLQLGDTEIITINADDLSGINQVLIEIGGQNHSMINIYGITWQNNSWNPASIGIKSYTIYIEDNNQNWNITTGSITVQDTIPPDKPEITISWSGKVNDIITFIWERGSDPSSILYYILIIDNERNLEDTPGYVYKFNITNSENESIHFELPEILPPGQYWYFLAQIDGVGLQSDYDWGTFTVINPPSSNDFMIFLIIVIIIASIIGSATAIVLVRKKLKKNIFPPREKVPLKIISSHINKLSRAQLTLKPEEIQSITDKKEIEIRINEIKYVGEELFAEGAYLEAQEQFKLGRDLLLNLGRDEDAKLFSDLISGIEGLIEEREKRLELLEQLKIEGNSVQIFELHQEIIAISKKLRDPDTTSFYQSELINYFQNLNLVDLEQYRSELNQKAESSMKNNIFEIAAQLYEKCENISQLFVQLGREEEIVYIDEFRSKKEECLKKI
jgi:hypothetical protein